MFVLNRRIDGALILLVLAAIISETLLREKIADRYNQIVNEYKWMMDCDSEEDRQFE
jgi:hypothetical protein